jgi:hypothetical protein
MQIRYIRAGYTVIVLADMTVTSMTSMGTRAHEGGGGQGIKSKVRAPAPYDEATHGGWAAFRGVRVVQHTSPTTAQPRQQAPKALPFPHHHQCAAG